MVQMKDTFMAERQGIFEKAKNLMHKKKKEWAKEEKSSMLKKLSITEFPDTFDEKTLKMQKANEKILPMLNYIEQAILKNVHVHRKDVGTALHSLQD